MCLLPHTLLWTLFVLTSRKTEIAKSACEPKWQKASCRRRHRRRSTSCGEILVTWQRRITKSSSKDVNLETIIDMQWWCRTWLPNGSSRVRAKQNLHMRRKKSLLKFLEPSHRPKVVNMDNSMEFGRACEVLSSNHRTSTPSRSETNGIAERAVRRAKEGTVSSITTVRTRCKVVVQTSCGLPLLSAKRPRPPGRYENAIRKTIWRTIPRVNNTFLEQWLKIIRLHRKIRQEFINLARKYYQASLLAMSWSPGEFGK